MITKKLIMAVSVAAYALSSGASASTYSITDDFSVRTNPNGAWSYGWLDVLGGTFTAYSAYTVSSSPAGGTIQAWHHSVWYPMLFNNSSASAFISGTSNYLAGWAGFHPGPQNQLSDFRFTAQTAGTYTLAFDFQGAETGTTTDVHVYSGGHNLFGANIYGYGDSSRQSFSGKLFLNAGQTVDIAVGYGANNTYWSDSTAVRGTIAAVPEPEAYAMLLAGLGLLGAAARRRKQTIAA